MTFRAPPTPPMSETQTTGIASGVLDSSDLAAKVSVRLFALSRKIRDALKPIEALSKDIASTGAILNQLGHQLKKDQDVRVGSTTLATSVEDAVEECSGMFDSIDKALDGNNGGSKAILGLQHYVSVVSLEPQLHVLETDIERLKTPLALMLQVLIYASQLKSQEDKSVIKEQQELIKELNEERKCHERRFQKLTGYGRKSSERSTTPPQANKELPPTPPARTSGTKHEISKISKRIWINDDSPPQARRSAQGNPLKPGNVRKGAGLPNRFEDDEEEDDNDERSSIFDLKTFLRLTGPDDARVSSEDPSPPPALNGTTSSRHQARDPVVRGDSSDLINFFREGSPRVDKISTAPVLERSKPVRNVTAPIKTGQTGLDDGEQQSPPLPAQFVPMQSHIRSQSASLPSPLGSHPPMRYFDPSRPATTKWPLQAVLAWLDKNSFSVEWQDTFKALQIWGSDFVGLESGQSIRKMLTIVYPHLAKECTASGKGWDQERERAEGQRLRKLIRELPVDIKYEHESLTSKPGADGTGAEPATRVTQQAFTPEPSSLPGCRRASTAPPEDLSSCNPVTATFARRRKPPPLGTEGISVLTENDEEEDVAVQVEKEHQQSQYRKPPLSDAAVPNGILISPAALPHHNHNPHHARGDSELSTISTEWVRKWTVLSPEEIARGRDTAPALFV